MIDLYELQRKAQVARSLYDDPAFREVYATLYGEALEEIRHSLPEEQAKREEAYWRLRTLEILDQRLQSIVKAPDHELQRDARRQ